MKPRIENLLFLKLGGSLITDKYKPRTVREGVIARLGEEIAAALEDSQGLRLLLGHGSGSFGHISAKKYRTREGVHTPREWQGFAEVWFDASTLNRMVVEALHNAGVPVISFPPGGGITSQAGEIETWNTLPLQNALLHGLVPVVYGDVVFDEKLGGTILSTENIFAHLALELHPQRILLAGIDEGVWADYPICEKLVGEITPDNFADVKRALSGSAATDVTGGMASKVEEMLALTEEIQGLEVCIFSGAVAQNVERVLRGEYLGTRIGL